MTRAGKVLVLITLCCWDRWLLSFVLKGSACHQVAATRGTPRRSILYVAGLHSLIIEQANAQDEKDMLLKRELPPLPRGFARDVKELAQAVRDAAITTVRVNRRGDAEAAKQLRGLEQDVANKLRAYERNWLTGQLEFNKLTRDDQGILQEHQSSFP